MTAHNLPDDMMARLAAPFALHQHDYRETTKGWGDNKEVLGYITYVGVEHAIRRMNDVLGDRWNWEIIETQIVSVPGFKDRNATEPPMVSGVITRGRISWIDNVGTLFYREGQGAAQFTSGADDLDKVVKSAQAEAFKKATHVLGIGAYLWDKGLADRIAWLRLKADGKKWGAKSQPKPVENAELAHQILGELRAELEGPAQPDPTPAPAAASTPAAQQASSEAQTPSTPSDPAPAAPHAEAAAPAKPGEHGSEEWLAANRAFRNAVGEVADECQAKGHDQAIAGAVSQMIAGIYKVESTKQLTAEQLTTLAAWIKTKPPVRKNLATAMTSRIPANV